MSARVRDLWCYAVSISHTPTPPYPQPSKIAPPANKKFCAMADFHPRLSRPTQPESANQAPPGAAAQSPDVTDGAPAATNNQPRTPDPADTKPADTKVSPPLTGECGGAEKYTCLGSQHGDCCSSYGYCGSEESYCGAGCQTAFGRCGGGTEDAKTG